MAETNRHRCGVCDVIDRLRDPVARVVFLLCLGGLALGAGAHVVPGGEGGGVRAAPELAQDWEVLLAEDFEGAFPGPGWEIVNADPGFGWGLRTCRARSGTRGAWSHGGGTLGTLLPCGEAYPPSLNTWMIYGPVSLAGVSAAELELAHFVDSEVQVDRLGILVSIDGDEFFGWNESGGEDAWRSDVFDLDAVPDLGGVLGEEQVWIAIAFRCDDTGGLDEDLEGAYVDDLVLRVDRSAPSPTRPTPEATETPAGAPAYLPLLLDGRR